MSDSIASILVGISPAPFPPSPLQLNTERTRLARTAMTFITVLATTLGDRFEPLVDPFLPVVLRLSSRANKVYVSTAAETLRAAIEACGAPSFIPTLVESIKSPSKSLRHAAMEGLLLELTWNSQVRLEPYADAMELAMREGVVDSTPVVRDLAKRMFERYKDVLPGRIDR
ncbi:hypothetical protein BDK51DRAFT_18238 [Blyttiomyces helicus]|uniref:CLASP N-terminal domain-containing protein n=1 Tax=Blyttiomyces helicus TaxID=388810 RepID=A0A4P9W7Z5_9FUNG|nr:hypothetical protein BDK51DRAFT_18238 [Blyttiomyces helicus]|eukprot:RKO87178.1 hypothetical protein BDK51DRAFT_18238 [Blyttiomyces helicus]